MRAAQGRLGVDQTRTSVNRRRLLLGFGATALAGLPVVRAAAHVPQAQWEGSALKLTDIITPELFKPYRYYFHPAQLAAFKRAGLHIPPNHVVVGPIGESDGPGKASPRRNHRAVAHRGG